MKTEEWKIGEIFEYNGEWLQCVEQPKKYDKTVCAICAFQGNGNCELDMCSGTYRSDKKSVIFKKLEKVGEQFLYKGKQMQSYIRATDELIWNNNLLLLEHVDSDIIDIEIKQNKEDMEEKNDIRSYDKSVNEVLGDIADICHESLEYSTSKGEGCEMLYEDGEYEDYRNEMENRVFVVCSWRCDL